MVLNKSTFLLELETKTEDHITFAVSILQNLPSETLNRPAINGGWSVIQILEHLNSYSFYYLPAIEIALENSSPIESYTFKPTIIGKYFRDLIDPETGKTKFKAFKKHLPNGNTNESIVISNFLTQQEILLRLIRKAGIYDIQQIKIPISIFRWIQISLGDVFNFLLTHNERHMQQAKRNLTD